MQEIFGTLDADSSGDLSKEEVAGFKPILEKRKAEIDARPLDPNDVTYEKFEALFAAGGECKLRCGQPSAYAHAPASVPAPDAVSCSGADESAAWLESSFKPDGGWPFIFNRLDVNADHVLR